MTTLASQPLQAPRFTQVHRLCPMCEADEVEYEFVVERVAFSRCGACNLLFANPPPGASAPPAGPETAAAYPALRAFAARYLGREPRSVLIVGDGTAPADAFAARRAPGDLAAETAQYDLVVAANVLERCADPLATATALQRLVAPDGALLATTPSAASRDARAQRDAWPALRAKPSWLFTPDTLQLLLTRAGFGSFAPLVDPLEVGGDPGRFFDSHLALFARPRERAPGRVLSVIVPVYNEKATVEELLERVLAKTIEGVDVEVVIVESNSSDGSREIVQRYAEHPRVRLVLEDRPRGKGFAVRTGLAHATGDVVLFQDADLEYDVNDYDHLIAPLFALRRNFLLGSRHGAAGDGWKIRRFVARPGVSTLMNVAHLALLTMFNRLYGQSLFDPFTMYKVFRRDCLHGLTFECNRFDFDFEINIKLLRKGYQPAELPVNYRSRGFHEGKKVLFFSDPPSWIRAMLKLRRAPLYVFGDR
jgi:SAM-dependent methyltransferase